MRSIWVRAGLGALAVFALGMLLYTGAGRTRDRARQALMELKSELDSGTVVAVDQVHPSVPFVLDGQAPGPTLAQLRQRGAPTIDSSHHSVHLNASGDSGELVNISADSNGAFIHVSDGKGKVVRVRADKNGLVVKVDSAATR